MDSPLTGRVFLADSNDRTVMESVSLDESVPYLPSNSETAGNYYSMYSSSEPPAAFLYEQPEPPLLNTSRLSHPASGYAEYSPGYDSEASSPQASYMVFDTMEASEERSFTCSVPSLAIIVYLFSVVGAAFVLGVERRNLFLVFHAWQSLVTGVLAFVIQIIFVWSTTAYTILWIAYLLFLCGMIVKVSKDIETQALFKLPLIGNWCERQALNRVHSAPDHNAHKFFGTL
eukprot:TRINITY_DN10669_c0_g1_i1.p1 TRINITY_DN10669_c0_g1~~TRINITY_DN10669_c0_g1_i1.p1  ORF type:complete len:230 (+),score=15.01 TRINITY_DN10669_c0_g1_i1:102-791(+)